MPSRLAFYYAFILVLLSSGFAQNGYEPGYYVDKYDSVHSGLIKYVPPRKWTIGFRIDSIEFNKFYFKENENSERFWVRPKMVKYLVHSEDTFEIIPVDPFTGSFVADFSRGSDFTDFVKVLERGKLELLEHAHPFPSNTAVPVRVKKVVQYDYYFRKNGVQARIEKGDEYSQIEFGRKRVIRNVISDDMTLLNSFNDKNYEKIEIRRLVKDYNARARGDIKQAKLVLIRSSKREISESITLGIGKEMISMPQNHMDTISITNVYDFEICPKDEDCQNLTGSPEKFVFMEVSKKEEENATRLSLMNDDEIKFYTTRISYLMEKAAKKKRK